MLDVIARTRYRGTSLIRTPFPLGPYSSPVPRGLEGSPGGGNFLQTPVVLQSATASCQQLLPQLVVLVDPSVRALSGRPKFTARRHRCSKDFLSLFSIRGSGWMRSPKRWQLLRPNCAGWRKSTSWEQGYLAEKKQRPPWDPTVGPCLGAYGGPRGRAVSYERA